MKKIILAITVVFSATTLVTNVEAAEVNWSGFASITGGEMISDTKRADGVVQRMYGYDDDINFTPESKLALQANSNLGDGLSVTAQAIARGSDDFNLRMEWAYISYDFGESSRVNVGRLRIPFFMYSDSLDVGYTYPWIRPPETVYDLFFSSMEGVSVQFNNPIGSWDSSLQLFGGREKDILKFDANVIDVNVKNLAGAAFTMSNDWLSLRSVYINAKTTFDSTTLTVVENTLKQVGFNKQANEFAVRDDKTQFMGLGFKAEKGGWFLASEATSIKIFNSFVGDQKSAYISVGKNIDKMMYILTYEHEHDIAKEGITAGIPYPTGTALDALTAGAAAAAASSQLEHTTTTFGVVYNFHPAASFKVDYAIRNYKTDQSQKVAGSSSVLRFSIDTVF